MTINAVLLGLAVLVRPFPLLVVAAIVIVARREASLRGPGTDGHRAGSVLRAGQVVVGAALAALAVVVPLLLTDAFHAKVDVPSAVAAAQARHPEVQIRATPILGLESRFLEVLDLRMREALKAVRGKVAIANAKMAYQWYLDFLKSDRWQALAAKGAQPQRLLWASTGVKDPSYPDTLYIDTLIGRDTVNTMPPKTMDAFRDHGTAAETITADVDGAKHVLAEAERLGLDLTGVTGTLVEEGVASFVKAFDDLLGSIAKKQPATA